MNYVNGEYCPHRSDISVENPANEECIGMIPNSTAVEVAEAIAVARKAFKKWRQTSRIYRADLFDKLAQLLKRDCQKLQRIMSLETGKNLNESYAEVIEGLHMCQVAAAVGREPFGIVIASELTTKDAYTMRKPKGVVAVISPWNFPLAIGSFWCSAPALVEGNCVVHKPSELTPIIAQTISELYHEAGFPEGVYNLIHGSDDTGKALVRGNVDCILFTGSAAVGQDIRRHCADTWSKTCSCEMGSKSAVIVCEDANMNLAHDATLASAFKLSGQRCVSASRILVHRSIVGAFVERFVNSVSTKVTFGDPFEVPAPFYGPLISKEQKECVSRFNAKVIADSEATVKYNGECSRDKGHFLAPFVYQTEWRDVDYLKEEVFGPHVAIIPFNDVEDAVRIYNDTDYGLALGVITEDFRIMRKIREECDTGMLYLNGSCIGAESHLPFGGVKKSGNGWKSAAGTYQAVTDEISVTTNFEAGRMQFAQGMDL